MLSKKDSTNLKKDLGLLLTKYRLKNKDFQLSITSINQKGGQTAFIINNYNAEKKGNAELAFCPRSSFTDDIPDSNSVNIMICNLGKENATNVLDTLYVLLSVRDTITNYILPLSFLPSTTEIIPTTAKNYSFGLLNEHPRKGWDKEYYYVKITYTDKYHKKGILKKIFVLSTPFSQKLLSPTPKEFIKIQQFLKENNIK